METGIAAARAVIAESEALLVCAGAGMGVDSGLPDFRGDEGFWRAYPPIRKLGYSFAEMANPRWFEENPRLAWAFYGHRLHLYRDIVPHNGFSKLLEAGRAMEGGYFVFTSNVDGQFQKAGFEDAKIVECHGSIHHLQCSRNCSSTIWTAEGIDVAVDETHFEAVGELPRCRACDALARPNILMFGDWLWQPQRSEAQERRLAAWLRECARKRLVIIEVGAGVSVPTVRHTSEAIARECGAALIRINPRDTAIPEGAISICTGALEGIEAIFG